MRLLVIVGMSRPHGDTAWNSCRDTAELRWCRSDFLRFASHRWSSATSLGRRFPRSLHNPISTPARQNWTTKHFMSWYAAAASSSHPDLCFHSSKDSAVALRQKFSVKMCIFKRWFSPKLVQQSKGQHVSLVLGTGKQANGWQIDWDWLREASAFNGKSG